jgi:hypothetical protein
MSCPPLKVLRHASPWLTALVQAAAAEAAALGRPVVSRLATLLGPYRVWEEVLAHAAGDHATWLHGRATEAPATEAPAAAGSAPSGASGQVSFAEAAHRYSLPALLGLLKLAQPYGFHRLANQYAATVRQVHLRRDTCAAVLRAAVQSRHWKLAVAAFRAGLAELEKTTGIGGESGGRGDESWVEPLAQAIGDFLGAAFRGSAPWLT